MATKQLREAFRFHLQYAGYIVGQRAACALRLAKAEQTARDLNLVVRWEEEDENPLDVFGDDDCTRAQARRIREGSSDLLFAYVPDPTGGRYATLASLGMIEISRNGRDPYRRVVEAELLSEAVATLRARLAGV